MSARFKNGSRFATVCLAGAMALTTVAGAQPRGEQDGETRRPERRMQDRQPQRGGPGMGGVPGGGFMQRMGQVYEPSVTSDQIRDYSKRLALTSEQQEVVGMLFEAYQTDFAAKARQARDRMEALRDEARETQDPTIWGDMGAERQRFAGERTKMEQAFFTDLKDVFTPEQANAWTRIERERRRQESMPMGVLSGERVDVVRLTETLDLSDDQRRALEPVLDQYQEELDRELVARDVIYIEAQGRMREFFTGGGDEASLQQLVERGRTAGGRVRDVNRRFSRQVEQMLPEEQRESFVSAVKRESFPMVYGPRSYGQRVLEAAVDIEGLTESQRTAIAAAREQYTRDAATINARMERAIEEQEATFDLAQMRQGGWFRMANEGPMGDLRRERRELDDTVVDKVRALLTPEQIEMLPSRRDGGGGGGQGVGRGEGGAQRGGRGGGDEGDRPQQRRRGRPQQGEQPADRVI